MILNREDNVLLYYDWLGNFRKKFIMIFRLRVKFIFFLYDLLGCFLVILILRYYELFLEIVVCVFIYNGNGKLELVFGEGVLLFLKKVVCFSRKFFVLDVDSKSVKVFNKNG